MSGYEEVNALIAEYGGDTKEAIFGLLSRVKELEAYADKLAAGLPDGMLPKDVENMREANKKFAQRIAELEAENARLLEVERKAIEQSDYIQQHGLTEYEVEGLRAELATQRELIGRPAEAIFGEYHDMRKELATLREANRWIPVSERLPENDDNVLILERYYKMAKMSYWGGKKWSRNEDYWYADGEVTHWRPLPEPPKMEMMSEKINIFGFPVVYGDFDIKTQSWINHEEKKDPAPTDNNGERI